MPARSGLAWLGFGVCKGLRAGALFLASDPLFHTGTPIPLFAFCVLLTAAAILGVLYPMPVHAPPSSPRR